MSEFEIINKYIKLAEKDDSVIVGIGDDAAVLQVPEDSQIVQTMDTMVAGVHFDEHFSAEALAHKLLHVNVSDIAAMGAKAQWATVALTVPEINETWITEFSSALQQRCHDLNINLVGGDTTSGPLSVTMNLTGVVKQGEFLTRSGAKSGDDIYVSGFLGDAALSLTLDELAIQKHDSDLRQRLEFPQARYALGHSLVRVATACIDVSDGLLADLQHICRASGLNAQVNVEDLPLSADYKHHFQSEELPISSDFALNGGDDYELCFTSSPENRDKIKLIGEQLQLNIARIGKIVEANMLENTTLVNCYLNGEKYQCERHGWEHFSQD